MNARNTLSTIIVIAFASAGAYVWPTAVPETVPPNEATTVVEPAHPSVAIVAHGGDHDAVAIHDMTLHAVRHLGTTNAQPDGFRAWLEWAPGWELRALAFESNGRTEIVYQATSKHRPEIRFTVTAGSGNPAGWELAD